MGTENTGVTRQLVPKWNLNLTRTSACSQVQDIGRRQEAAAVSIRNNSRFGTVAANSCGLKLSSLVHEARLRFRVARPKGRSLRPNALDSVQVFGREIHIQGANVFFQILAALCAGDG